MQLRSRRSACFVGLILLASSDLFAVGGTDTIATKGQPVAVSAAWPKGVGVIVNDPTRTSGWNSWFSEWPNDVNQYAFEITTIDDLNRLIEKLSATKSEVRQIRLSPLKEPSGLGWVTSLPKGNDIAVIFSVGNQSRIDEWYKRVRKPFGVMEFTAAPIAVPPTLTIFVQNKAVNLEQLTIPKGIIVTSGYVPTVFHRFNTKDEKKREEEAARKPVPIQTQENLDPATQAAADKIATFLKKQKPTSSETILEKKLEGRAPVERLVDEVASDANGINVALADDKPASKDLGKIKPPGGVPLNLGRPGEEIKVDGLKKATKRLDSTPQVELDKWIFELERIMETKLEGDLASQACRTYFVIRMSVAFDDLQWNFAKANKFFLRAQTLPASEANAWKEAFEALLKKEIGQTAKTNLDGGPAYAVPLVLIPIDALHEREKYSPERGKKYLARLKQLTADDVSLWYDKVDEFGGTNLDAVVNIILLDDFFDKEQFRPAKFQAAIEARKK